MPIMQRCPPQAHSPLNPHYQNAQVANEAEVQLRLLSKNLFLFDTCRERPKEGELPYPPPEIYPYLSSKNSQRIYFLAILAQLLQLLKKSVTPNPKGIYLPVGYIKGGMVRMNFVLPLRLWTTPLRHRSAYNNRLIQITQMKIQLYHCAFMKISVLFAKKGTYASLSIESIQRSFT